MTRFTELIIIHYLEKRTLRKDSENCDYNELEKNQSVKIVLETLSYRIYIFFLNNFMPNEM